MNPLLRWPGGKRRLIRNIQRYIPPHYNRYFEPFCGGAALFFSLQPSNSLLCDINVDLIECYRAVVNNTEAVIDILSSFPNTESQYYWVRAWRPTNTTENAARLIYLSRLSFNGIYRVNHKGEHNVPYSHRVHLPSCDAAVIHNAAQALQQAILIHGDFATAVAPATAGDLIYFDPPYTVAHSRNGFIKYNDLLFSWQDQERVAYTAEVLRRRGCFVLVSNADHDSIRNLYPNFREIILQRHSVIAATNSARKRVTESLFVATPQGFDNED